MTRFKIVFTRSHFEIWYLKPMTIFSYILKYIGEKQLLTAVDWLPGVVVEMGLSALN